MANNYFQFKRFRVNQENCAMKVCTDACLFGALAPLETAHRILDIGTGTGLLALMAAQRSSAQIEAVEIDPHTAAQARENIAASPWNARITVFETPLQKFTPARPYDFILSNPPFFTSSLKPTAANQQVAKHATSLSFQELLAFAATQLTPAGKLCILLPEYEQQLLASIATQYGLFPEHSTKIRNRPGGKVIRVVSTYSFGATAATGQELVIRTADGDYTPEFSSLLKDFYLAF